MHLNNAKLYLAVTSNYISILPDVYQLMYQLFFTFKLHSRYTFLKLIIYAYTLYINMVLKKKTKIKLIITTLCFILIVLYDFVFIFKEFRNSCTINIPII